MREFIVSETKKAFERLKSLVIFTLKCVFISIVNILVTGSVFVMTLLFILRGCREVTEDGKTSPAMTNQGYVRSGVFPSTNETLQSASRDLRYWIAQLRSFKW